MRTLLNSRYALLLILLAPVFAVVPTVSGPFLFDELTHWEFLDAQRVQTGIRAPETTLMGQTTILHPQKNSTNIARGALAWWASPDALISFWRPAGEPFHVLDEALFPGSAVAFRLHTLAWWLAFLAFAAFAYRRLLGAQWIATFAVAALLLQAPHEETVVWYINRYSIIAALGSVGVLLLHRTWRENNTPWAGPAAPLVALLSLLIGEQAIASAALVIAYECCLQSHSVRRRALSTMPVLLVCMSWMLVYFWMQFGAANSGLYLDPFREPLAFLSALPRAPIVHVMGQLGWPRSATFNFMSPELQFAIVTVGAISICLLLLLLRHELREDRVLRFFGTALTLSLIPSASKIWMSARTDLVVAFCAAGFASRVLQRLVEASPSARAAPRFLAQWCAFAAFLGFHIVPCALHLMRLPSTMRAFAEFSASMGDIERDHDIAGAHVVVANAASPQLFFYLWARHRREGRAPPATITILAPAYGNTTVRRVSERSLEVEPEFGFLPQGSEQLHSIVEQAGPRHLVYWMLLINTWCHARHPNFQTGPLVELPNAAVSLTTMTPDGRPAVARFDFSRPLDAPELVWLSWNPSAERFDSFSLPLIGEPVILPGLIGDRSNKP